MDIDTFKEQLFYGMGRCYTTLRDATDKAPYREAITWALTHNVSVGCKGRETRGAFLFELVCLFDDSQSFLGKITEAYFDLDMDSAQLSCQMGDVLVCYAKAGYVEATKTLRAKLLCHIERGIEGEAQLNSAFVTDLLDMVVHYKKVASPQQLDEITEKMEAMRRSCHAQDSNSRVLQRMVKSTIGLDKTGDAILEALRSRRTLGEKEIDDLFDSLLKDEKDSDYLFEQYRMRMTHRYNPIEILRKEDEIWAQYLGDTAQNPVFISNDPTKDDVAVKTMAPPPKEVTDKLTNGLTQNEWDNALNMIGRRQYMGDALPLIVMCSVYDNSPYIGALMVLQHMRDEKVRKFAELRLDYSICSPIHLYMMVFNDNAKNHARTMHYLTRLSMRNKDLTAPTLRARTAISTAVAESECYGVHLTRDLYEYAYEHTLFDNIRYDIVRLMAQKGWLTDAMIEECAHDSNGNLRAYIRRKYVH